MNYLYLFLAFVLGAALGGAVTFRVTADTYEDELDRSYKKELQNRHIIDKLEDEIDRLNLRPVHCPAPVKVTQIGIDWNELDFPNSEEVKE